MSQLTDISQVAKKFVFILIGLVGSYFIFIFLLKVTVAYIRSMNKPKTAPPTVNFGKLPLPRFAEFASNSNGLTFQLLTVEGAPPQATAAAKVYKMPKKLPSFSISQRAINFAKKLDFTGEPSININTYTFVSERNPMRTLTVEGVYLNFFLKYNYAGQPEIFAPPTVKSKEQLETIVTEYIKNRSLFDDTVFKGKKTLQLLHLDPATNTLVPVTSLAASTAVRIDFFRQDLDGLPLVTPEFFRSYNYTLFAQGSKKLDASMLEISYTFWPISQSDIATYPIKSAQAAYQELTEGNAYVINKGQNDTDINIRKIYLGYFDDAKQQDFLQPVFVFEGDREFVSFTPAIVNEHLMITVQE